MNSRIKKLFKIIGLIEFENQWLPSFYVKAMINRLAKSTLPTANEKMKKLIQALESSK